MGVFRGYKLEWFWAHPLILVSHRKTDTPWTVTGPLSKYFFKILNIVAIYSLPSCAKSDHYLFNRDSNHSLLSVEFFRVSGD